MYPKDWNEDHDLKMCSFAAEGLWIRLVNTSFEMPVKGVFSRRLNGGLGRVETKLKPSLTPLKLEEIANLIRGNTREKMRLLQELIANNVLKRLADGECAGAFYVKRIYEDMKLRAIRAEAGKQGGNPNLSGHLVENLLNQNPEQTPKQIPTPSSSSSTSTSNNTYTHADGGGPFTLCQVMDAAAMIGITPDKAEEFFHHFNAQGWVRSNGLKITNLGSALTYWRNHQYQFEKHNFREVKNETHKRDYQSAELGFR